MLRRLSFRAGCPQGAKATLRARCTCSASTGDGFWRTARVRALHTQVGKCRGRLRGQRTASSCHNTRGPAAGLCHRFEIENVAVSRDEWRCASAIGGAAAMTGVPAGRDLHVVDSLDLSRDCADRRGLAELRSRESSAVLRRRRLTGFLVRYFAQAPEALIGSTSGVPNGPFPKDPGARRACHVPLPLRRRTISPRVDSMRGGQAARSRRGVYHQRAPAPVRV